MAAGTSFFKKSSQKKEEHDFDVTNQEVSQLRL